MLFRSITLQSLKNEKISEISLLGNNNALKWTSEEDGIKISLPADPVSPYANTMKIELEKE